MVPPVPAPEAARARPDTNRWLIALTMTIGTFMVVMDISVVNVALPYMIGNFGQSLSSITWVATSYSIAEIIMLTMAGWWTALLGRKRLYLASYALFTAGSILAGTSQSFTQMLVYRTIQGMGGGSLIPLSLAILRETFPPAEQGIAMGVYSMGVVVAPALGPVVGGYLTDRFGWPWIFYINVPFSILGMFLVSALIHDPPYLRRGVGRVDWTGIALLTVGLTGLQVVLERGEQYGWFESRWIVEASVVTGLALVLLVVWEFLARSPVVDLRLLRDIALSVGSAMGLIFGVALYGTTFVLPEFTQTLLGYTAFDAGLVLLPRALVIFILNPVVGWLYNHVDARWLIVFGSVVVFEGYRELAQLSLAAAFWNMVPAMVLLGTGMPFLFVPMTTVSVSTVSREDVTSASALYTLARRVGGNIGYALVATLVDSRSQFHRARLGANISALNPTFRQFDSGLIAILKDRGVGAAQAPQKALGLIDQLLNQHAAMLAYNNVSWLFGIIFLVAMPLVLLLPGRSRTARRSRAAN